MQGIISSNPSNGPSSGSEKMVIPPVKSNTDVVVGAVVNINSVTQIDGSYASKTIDQVNCFPLNVFGINFSFVIVVS